MSDSKRIRLIPGAALLGRTDFAVKYLEQRPSSLEWEQQENFKAITHYYPKMEPTTSSSQSATTTPPQPPTPPLPQPEPSEAEKGAATPPPAYSAFSPWRRRFILSVITVAGFFGPLAGGIYLPALPVLEQEFNASATAINVTVSVFMLTFAFGVSIGPFDDVDDVRFD